MPADPLVTPLGATATAYLQLPGGWFLNNAGWITGTERTVLVDTCATEARSRHLLQQAQAAHPHVPVSAVLTHAHGDHAHGAGLVTASGGDVLATAAAAADIATGPHTYPELFDCTSWGEITPPEQLETLTESTSWDLGGTTVEIHPVPTHAHTNGDLVVWQPDDEVLFTGDLAFHGVTPLAMHGSISGWVEALDWLENFQATQLVPGHGPVITAQDTALAELRDYLRWLLEAVGTTENPDFDALEAQARESWATWHDAERHAVNLRRAHAETHGHDFDIITAAGAMLESAGGPITLTI
ncbi:cyclase [Saccharopolyspora lacisalsi]|uniref:Cyclase n=1 Tax=Halosaccharopolyspora lacisalsi TaxID=1000566 RepID=A0A839DXC7_9PSEU|nr:MBL fold metallo-hydrolase [Halosaccharopolyspora lacisalsi]MBA8823871.1 cyclase [Halosaccharopolyspora lacisalsi]